MDAGDFRSLGLFAITLSEPRTILVDRVRLE
jgi:hypothetical protein